MTQSLRLSNGVTFPLLGLGTYQTPEGSEVIQSVHWALEAGYRHIDTAQLYANEKGVGQAVQESDIPRKDIFITTKIWNDNHGYDRALKSFEQSLAKLSTGYVDLLLIHWPYGDKRKETWRALERLYEEKTALCIGVSNYAIRHLEEMRVYANTAPQINQVEFSPFLYQKELLDYCKKNDIILTAYSPLARARKMDNPVLQDISERTKRTKAQVMLRWALQHGLTVIPKSTRRERIVENGHIFNFDLSEEDMTALDGLNEDFRVAPDPNSID